MKTLLALLMLGSTGLAAHAANWNVTYDRWGMPLNIPSAPDANACRAGNAAACKHWRVRSCFADANPAACDYDEAQKQKDPAEFCSQRYGDYAPAYRFCVNGSPER
jgi:hypothetical protein